jgi:F-type H+-transporting ATPase subunit b
MVSVDIDFSVVLQMINFFVFMVIFNFLVLKPLKKFMTNRDELIDNLRLKADESEKLLAESELREEKRRIEVLEKGAALRITLKQEGKEREKTILAEAQNQASDFIDKAKERLSFEVTEARKTLDGESQDLAASLVQKLLGRSQETLN